MMKRSLFSALGLTLTVLLPAPATAQANAIPGIDVELAFMNSLSVRDRMGVFPNGVNALAMSTTICNRGTEIVPWFAPMDSNHPIITFIIAREANGRFEQISDYSYMKHGFFALTSSQCTSCTPPGGGAGNFLGLGCSDTYGVGNNGDNFWLGPPSEVDPWLGIWDPICSHFDRGEPAVSPPFDCDGNRSFTGSQAGNLGPIGHRIKVQDADLDVPGGQFFYQGYYNVRSEPEMNREDNMSHRQFFPSFNGTNWTTTPSGSLLHGSILTRWTGASVGSSTNGGDDGRVYVAVRVTGPTQGLYRYTYAVHNRDNKRGVDALHIPTCDDARILNVGFHDVDQEAGNQWSTVQGAGELVYSTANNPINWNSFFTFWFDSDAAPVAGQVTLDQHAAGGGAPFLQVGSTVPGKLSNVFVGAGCANGGVPTLYATGSPAQATIGNATFGLQSGGNVAGQAHFLFQSPTAAAIPLGGCTIYVGSPLSLLGATVTAANGRASYSVPVPNNPAVEGIEVELQGLGINPAGGPIASVFELTDGLRVRVGDNQSDCP